MKRGYDNMIGNRFGSVVVLNADAVCSKVIETVSMGSCAKECL